MDQPRCSSPVPGLLPGLLCTVLIGGCTGEDSPDEQSGFSHGSPRPACQETVDVARTPWFETPVVVGAGWGEPVRLAEPLTTPCPEDAIEISRDGTRLCFFWSPVVNGTNEQLLHITTGTYCAERVGEDPGLFADPGFLDLQKECGGGSVDGAPCFTAAGDTVYFHSTRGGNIGYGLAPPVDDPLDIYVARVVEGEPGPALNLGRPVNSEYLDGEHTLAPDGSRLFLSSNRPGGLGGVDLWISTRVAGAWTEPVNPGAPLNSPGDDLQPAFAADHPGLLYFVSDRDGPAGIYRSTFGGAAWSPPEPVITGYVGEPSLVADGSLLYFVHVLVDEEGVFGADIWYLRRLE